MRPAGDEPLVYEPSLPVDVDHANAPVLRSPVRLGQLALKVVAISVAAASIAGWLGGRWLWPCELACHFRVQYFWLLAGCSLAYVLLRRYRPAAALAAVAAANLAVVLPIYWPASGGEATGPRLRLVSCNVLMSNHSYGPLISLLRQNEPDMFALMEVDRAWLGALAPLQTTYPHSRAILQGGRFGIALYSRKPWKTIDELSMGPHHAPVLRALFEDKGQRYVVYCTHTMSPATRWQAGLRNQELLDLARMIGAEHDPVVLAGDLNSTGWSPRFADLLTDARLKDSRQGIGVQASWPTEFMLLGIPIDHCLVSPEIQVLSRKVGERVGSDHFPIIIELRLPKGDTLHSMRQRATR
jgi:endonuclease/exonuclease/phosphatase (EEP) superfamily protein YafD